MSCGQQALERSGFQVTNYYASEIDKYAIQVTQHNYPNTIQLGSVVDINAHDLPKIDVLIGGSPCQSFSFAGKMKGMSTKDSQEILTLEHYLDLKEKGFQFEGQSYLFWEYMRILNELRVKNPNVYFLLENVKMAKKWEDVLTKAIGVKGIHINSNLVSAQNRKRIYWTNIGLVPNGLLGDMKSIIEQPKDKGIMLKDILEKNVDQKYFISQKAIERINKTDGGERCFDNSDKAMCLKMGYFKQGRDNQFIVEADSNNKRLNETIEKHQDQLENGTLIDSYNQTIHKDKSITISTRVSASNNTHIVDQRIIATQLGNSENFGNATNDKGKAFTLRKSNPNGVIIETEVSDDQDYRLAAMRGRPNEEGKNEQRLEFNNTGKTNCLTSVEKDNYLVSSEAAELFGCVKFGRTEEAKKIRKESMKNGKDYTPFQGKEITGIDYKKMNTLTTATTKDNLIMQINPSKESAGKQPYQQNRIYDADGISPALMANKSDLIISTPASRAIRRLTPVECERLQTVKDNYTACVSDTQRYRMLGNGWTVDVIAHILKNIEL